MRRVRSRWFKPVARLFAAYIRDGGVYLAGTVSFFALMSFIPLLFLMINVFANVMGHSQTLQDAVINYVKAIYPMAGPVLKREVARMVSHSEAGWISLFIFLWLGSIVFESLDYSLNIIFKSSGRRRYLVVKLLSFGLVLMSGVFFMASFVVAYIPRFLSRQGLIIDSSVTRFLMQSVFIQFMPFLLTFLSFTLLYKILPKARIKYRHAAVGGFAAAVLWETAKYAFAWYVANIANVGIYGSFSTIILFLLWIYYSSSILLMVAEGMYLGFVEN